MAKAPSTRAGIIGSGSPDPGDRARDHPEAAADLRRVRINPDFWYPVAESRSVRTKTTFPAVFAGERIALYRGESGTVYALEDRCAHRQVPLSMGVVEGESLRCCYHAWAAAPDYTCNHIGVIVGQSPAVGTSAILGSPVEVTVGVRPPTPCP